MLEIHNSCERGLDECAALFEKADEKFTFCGGKQPGGSNLWIIEAAETRGCWKVYKELFGDNIHAVETSSAAAHVRPIDQSRIVRILSRAEPHHQPLILSQPCILFHVKDRPHAEARTT